MNGDLPQRKHARRSRRKVSRSSTFDSLYRLIHPNKSHLSLHDELFMQSCPLYFRWLDLLDDELSLFEAFKAPMPVDRADRLVALFSSIMSNAVVNHVSYGSLWEHLSFNFLEYSCGIPFVRIRRVELL